MKYPRPSVQGTDRRLSQNDVSLLNLMVVCASALVVGCLGVTAAMRELSGDADPVVIAVQVGTTAVLLVGFVYVAVSRRKAVLRMRELARTQERFRAFYRASPAGIFETDLQQRIVHFNAAFGAMLGLGPEDILGHPGWEFFHADGPPPDVAALQDLIAGARSAYSGLRLFRAGDGSPLPVKLDWAAIRDTSGVATQLACVVTDISEQARAAAEVARARERAEALWHAATIGVIEATTDGVITSVNGAIVALLGQRLEDLIGASVSGLADPAYTPEVDAGEAWLDPVGDGADDDKDDDDVTERRFLSADGRSVPVLVSTTALHDEHGASERIVSFVVDVSELHAQRKELIAARDELERRQSFTDALLETLDVGVVSCAADGSQMRRNRVQREILGVAQGDAAATLVENTAGLEILALDGTVLAAGDYPMQSALDGRDPGVQELLIGPEGGPHRQVVVRTSSITSPDGALLGAVSALSDVTAERQAARQLAEESDRLLEAQRLVSGVLAATPDFTFVTELATGAVVYAPPGKDVLGITSEELRNHGAGAIFALIHPDSQERLRAANHEAAHLGEGEVLQINYRALHRDGGWRWLSRRVTPFRRNAEGQVVEVLGVVRDVTDMIEAQDRLQHNALHDALTGLPNRALLMDRLEAALGRAMQSGREAAVLFCDLDGFKRVNDTAGHATGDAVLVETSRRISAALREHDTVARVGGDEFVIIVEPWQRESTTGLDDAPFDDRALAVQLAERVALALRVPVEVDGVEHVVTASIGITYAGTEAVAADDVLRDADAAMYRAKHGGKDRFEVFEYGLRADLTERGRVEHILRRAVAPTVVPVPLGTPMLTAAYQPVVDAATGALVGFEALARLSDGEGETIPPDVFIPVAENTALIRSLGMLMLDQACSQLAHWRRTVPGMAHVTMAVNVSALQAQHASLLADVRGTLRAHGLTGSDLVLELTESSLLEAGHSTLTALWTLREDGVGIAIDDFGTGYASLRYLTTLPVSAVKVDRSFTAGLPHDPTCRTIVRAVASLAAELGLTCIVEGVETEEQRSALPEGVQLQGWLTGRPALDPDVLALLAVAESRPPSRPVILLH